MGIIVKERPCSEKGPRVEIYFRTEKSDFLMIRYRYEEANPIKTRFYMIKESSGSTDKLYGVEGNIEIMFDSGGQKLAGKFRKLLNYIDPIIDIKKITVKDWYQLKNHLLPRKQDNFRIYKLIEKYKG